MLQAHSVHHDVVGWIRVGQHNCRSVNLPRQRDAVLFAPVVFTTEHDDRVDPRDFTVRGAAEYGVADHPVQRRRHRQASRSQDCRTPRDTQNLEHPALDVDRTVRRHRRHPSEDLPRLGTPDLARKGSQ